MKSDIEDFWQHNPCGEQFVNGLTDKSREAYLDFFRRYDLYRYTKEPHILKNLQNIDWQGKKVLEIGLGQGADAEQIARLGGEYSGVDLTQESVDRVRMRFALKSLSFNKIERSSAIALPFEDGVFDVVFSHGVLHHIPDIAAAEKEISRVLKPGGRLIMMVYARWSLNYMLSIMFLRRLGLLFLVLTGAKPGGIYDRHIENAKLQGVFSYLRMSNFLNVSTDGPDNPYSRVYSAAEIKRAFPHFRLLTATKEFMHSPPLNVSFLPLAKVLGWHLWAELEPSK